MNRRQKIIVTVTGIFIVLLVLIGLTYAYFLTQIKGNTNNKSISVTTADLKLVYGDGNGVVSLTNIMPGDPIPTKTFTVTNDGTARVDNYKVYLENVQNQLELKDDLKYTLTCKSFTKADYEAWEALEDEDKTINDLTEQGTCTGASSTTFPSMMSVIATNSIDANYTHYYELKVEYIYQETDQSIDMNKLVQAKINIHGEQDKFLAMEILDNALNVTEEEKAKKYAEFLEVPKTNPGSEISALAYGKIDPTTYSNEKTVTTSNFYVYSDEIGFEENGKYYLINPQVGIYSEIYSNLAGKYLNSTGGYADEASAREAANESKYYRQMRKISNLEGEVTPNSYKYDNVELDFIGTESELSTTIDDLGTSYYFRGSVENNYLEFNNMCFRIVRIEGDGSVKLTLAAQKKCTEITEEDFETAFIGQGTYGYTQVDSITQKINFENSDNIETSLNYINNKWYEDNLEGVKNKLKSSPICIGSTEVKESYGFGSGWIYHVFDNYLRITDNKTASLRCSVKTNNSYYVSPLTVDEIAYAGAIYSNSSTITTQNFTFYLLKNAGNSWWTSSVALNLNHHVLATDELLEVIPKAFHFVSSIYNGLVDEGYIYYNDVDSSNQYIRPSISLISGLEYIKGDGSINNPYIVN